MSEQFLTEFTFENSRYQCEIEQLVDSSTGNLFKQLVIKKNNYEHIKMAYQFGFGLKAIDTRKKNNPLGEFLGIQKNDLTAIKSFIENYGFLFISKEQDKYTKVNLDEFFLLQERLQAFINIINNQSVSSISLKDINYEELLNSVVYLMLKDYPNTVSDEISNILENKNSINELINSPHSFDTNRNNKLVTKNDKTGQIIQYYSATDYLSNTQIDIEKEEFIEYINDENIPLWIRNLTKLFIIKDNIELSDNTIKKVDFLFQLTKYISFDKDSISLINLFPPEIYLDIITDPVFLNSLHTISKLLISEEFERCLKNVTPTYNVDELRPDWKLPSLISALYFSVYYRNSKNSAFRKCFNVNCNQLFEVSKTNSKKKYCCDACRNVVGQRHYQSKKNKGH